MASLFTSGSMRIVVAGMFEGMAAHHLLVYTTVRPFYRLYAAGATQ